MEYGGPPRGLKVDGRMGVLAKLGIKGTGGRPPRARYPAFWSVEPGRLSATLKTGGMSFCLYMVVKMGL